MTDSDTRRDEIAGLLKSLTLPDDEDAWDTWCDEAAGEFIAAGLVVPEGLTAEKLDKLADFIDIWLPPQVAEVTPQWSALLRAWADALGVPEAKTETPRHLIDIEPNDDSRPRFERFVLEPDEAKTETPQ